MINLSMISWQNLKNNSWQESFLNLIIPQTKAKSTGLWAEMGVKAGIVAVMMIFRENLILSINSYVNHLVEVLFTVRSHL